MLYSKIILCGFAFLPFYFVMNWGRFAKFVKGRFAQSEAISQFPKSLAITTSDCPIDKFPPNSFLWNWEGKLKKGKGNLSIPSIIFWWDVEFSG